MDPDVEIATNVRVVMRDGAVLRADVYRPRVDRRLPALLLRIPYNKELAQSYVYAHPLWYARQGFAVVVQDVRGRYRSDGAFYPLRQEADDAVDTLAWLGTLPFIGEAVGMYGFSYPGKAQLLAAARGDPRLAAIAPGFCGSGMYATAFTNGAFNLAMMVSWSIQLALDEARWQRDRRACQILSDALETLPRQYATLPLRALAPLRATGRSQFFFDMLDHPVRDAFWRDLELGAGGFEAIGVPGLHFGGWYDTFVSETLRTFEHLSGRADQFLLVGPWLHLPWSPWVGETDFGDAARCEIDEVQVRWFRHWLVDGGRGELDLPRVRIFVMGRNEWRSEGEWPLGRARDVTFFLHSGGRANSLNGDGWLSADPPGNEPADMFAYNPLDPVPSLGGHSCCFPHQAPMGPCDQRAVEARNDVLVYSSRGLEAPMEVTGRARVRLFVASSAATTDFTVKLVDVHADGRAVNLCESVFRVGEPTSPGRLLRDGEVRELSFEVGVTSNWFGGGHRVRLEVSSSNFPMYDRNLNSLSPSDEWSAVVATQRVFHTAEFASALILPVVG